jgi:hypothetical protein
MVNRRIVQTNRQQEALAGPAARTTDLAAARTVDRNRRTVRSQELVAAVQALDTTTDPQLLDAVKQWIREEYDNRQGGQLVGLFSRCYLGHPYVDHRLDLSGGLILEHFTAADDPPPPFLPARPFARSDAYIYVEVYSDGAVVPVRADGRPVV